jgi:hypothetical protein
MRLARFRYCVDIGLLGKNEVPGSSPGVGSSAFRLWKGSMFGAFSLCSDSAVSQKSI